MTVVTSSTLEIRVLVGQTNELVTRRISLLWIYGITAITQGFGPCNLCSIRSRSTLYISMKLMQILQELGDSSALSWNIEDLDDLNIDFWAESRSPKVEGYLVTLALEEEFMHGAWELSFKAGKDPYSPSAYHEMTDAREVIPLLKAIKEIVEYCLDPEAWQDGGQEPPNIKAIIIAPTSDKRSRVYSNLLKKTTWSSHIKVSEGPMGITLMVK